MRSCHRCNEANFQLLHSQRRWIQSLFYGQLPCSRRVSSSKGRRLFVGERRRLFAFRIRGAGRELTRCIRYELQPRRWHHVALSFVYSRWAKSEIVCYVDGSPVETIEAAWHVSAADYFDRCSIGCGADGAEASEAFAGQLGAIYVFATHISPAQAAALHALGPHYQSALKHEAETSLTGAHKRQLFDNRLASSLLFAYFPKNGLSSRARLDRCHIVGAFSSRPTRSICRQQTDCCPLCFGATRRDASRRLRYDARRATKIAALLKGVEVITTHSIHNSLNSVGGIQMLLPLFAQIDMPLDENSTSVDYTLWFDSADDAAGYSRPFSARNFCRSFRCSLKHRRSRSNSFTTRRASASLRTF